MGMLEVPVNQRPPALSVNRMRTMTMDEMRTGYRALGSGGCVLVEIVSGDDAVGWMDVVGWKEQANGQDALSRCDSNMGLLA